MTSIKDRVTASIKDAMKAQDKDLLTALRGISSELVKEEKVNNVTLASDQELKIVTKIAKQRSEALAIYKEQDRPDLAAVEAYQLSVINTYLPKQVDAAIVAAFVKGLVDSGTDNIGRIMGALNVEYKSQPIDMKAAKQVADELIAAVVAAKKLKAEGGK